MSTAPGPHRLKIRRLVREANGDRAKVEGGLAELLLEWTSTGLLGEVLLELGGKQAIPPTIRTRAREVLNMTGDHSATPRAMGALGEALDPRENPETASSVVHEMLDAVVASLRKAAEEEMSNL